MIDRLSMTELIAFAIERWPDLYVETRHSRGTHWAFLLNRTNAGVVVSIGPREDPEDALRACIEEKFDA